MGSYIPTTDAQRQAMLEAIGLKTMDDLFADVPSSMRVKELNLPAGKSELELRRQLEEMAAKNVIFPTVFRGAGAYRHYIPATVKQISSKETFVTSYTPYQAEISQGVLQIIFEYQTEICALTGMDVSNASIYDGASAAAEATTMCRERKRQRTLVAATAHPDTIETIGTYTHSLNSPMDVVAAKDGVMDLDALRAAVAADVSCLYIQSPNYFGQFEDVEKAVEICHEAGVKVIYGCNPVALAMVKTPAEVGADIAVGEAQPLGMSLSFGGPYLGFIASTKGMMRRIPGRIVGETKDADGNRCFVLTLQAREQHIRREKATSSVCSNQALCALISTVYLAVMGPNGLREVASQSYSKAHYAAKALADAGFKRVNEGDFFHEFVTTCPVDSEVLMAALEKEGILGGLPVEGGILWCCTEMNTKAEIDKLVEICKEVAAK